MSYATTTTTSRTATTARSDSPKRVLFADGRQWVADRASGDVLEVAVGTGRNLRHHRPGTIVTGVDLSKESVDIARRRASGSPACVRLHVADAQHLPFADATFDTVVATSALCSIPDDGAAVSEAARALRPGGALVLLEHVRSPLVSVRTVQRLLEALLWRLQGDRVLREPDERVAQAGLHVELLERSELGIVLRLQARKTPGRNGGRAPTTPAGSYEQKNPR